MKKFPAFPSLPLLCLQTARDTSTLEICQGKNTVIDFWTTRCTRCPAALDALHEKASLPQYSNVQFASICCDKCDGAREIIEQTDPPRWYRVHHYYMTENDKEQAKAVLGFQSVPFYVVLNDQGNIVQMGNKIDWDNLPGCATTKQIPPGSQENRPINLPVAPPPPSASIPQSFFVEDMDF